MIAMMPVRQRVIALIATLIAACLLSERTHAWVVSPAYIKAGIQRASTHSSTSSSRTSCIIKRGGHVQARWQGARDTAGGASASNRGYFSTARSRWSGRNFGLEAAADASVQNDIAGSLTEEAIKTIVSSINKLPDDVIAYVMGYTPIGTTARQKNAVTAGAYVVESAEVSALDGEGMDIEVAVRTRSFFGKVKKSKETVRVSFDKEKGSPLVSAEGVKRRLMEMSREQGRTKSTAAIYKMPVGSYGGLPRNLMLNNVPHSKLARNVVYKGAAEAVVEAVKDPAVPRRMKLVCTVPELNVSMDTYRVGTMLEMIREVTYSLVDIGLNTRILIQPSMGDGIFKSLPLSLSGVMAIMKGMDWEEGLVGTHVNFGELGNKADVSAEDDVMLVISPQSIAGHSIHQLLVDTVEEAAGRPVIIINPNLKDRPSSGGVMQVRGRGDRISFAESFKDVYNFRLLYSSSVAFFPIKGAVLKAGLWEPYVVFDRTMKDKVEEYVPLATFDNDPDGADITPLWESGTL